MTTISGFRGILRALKNPNYGAYTAGSSVSLIGSWMQRVATGWLTWELTGSGTWLGVMAFADLFPTVLIGPFAGAAADRLDRLRVTKISQALAMLQAVALFLLTVAGAITIWWLLALTAFLGIVTAFNQPARLAMIPSLVPRQDLSAAIAINSIVFNVARFLGPAAAGAVIVAADVAWAYFVNALTFVWFLVALSRVRLTGPSEIRRRADRNLLGDLVDGIRYAAGHTGIAPLLVLLIVVCVGARPVVELLPGFAARVFASGAGGLAMLTSAIGVGAVAGGLWLAGRRDPRGLTRVALYSVLALALFTGLFAATDRMWVALPALAATGFCMVGAGIGTQTLLQFSVDGAMRGRVMSLYGLIFRGGPAVGALAMGAASEVAGLRWPVLAGACLVLIAWAWALLRRTRMTAALEAGFEEKA
jgi:MFS family permease